MSIFLPDKIKVGYQKRNDTYSKKLAYVIYYDDKGKLRKETSWQSWRDKKIEPDEFKNEPTSGFVLNKKVGGYASHWNVRQTYTRIYDPRGFEFEITIPNLLYILENTSAIKGKGLEGEFVYGWDGTELLLIPTSAPDYQELIEYKNNLFNKEKITSKNITAGARYLTNKNEELIYLGRFEEWNKGPYDYNTRSCSIKKYMFRNPNSESSYDKFERLASLSGKIIKCLDPSPASNYADLMDELEVQTFYSPIDEDHFDWIEFNKDNFHLGEEIKFTWEGIEWTTQVNKNSVYDYDEAEYKMLGYYLSTPSRVNKIPNATYSYHNYGHRVGDPYYDEYRDDKRRELDKLFKEEREMSKKRVLEIAKEFGFMMKQRYLRNGKKHYAER